MLLPNNREKHEAEGEILDVFGELRFSFVLLHDLWESPLKVVVKVLKCQEGSSKIVVCLFERPQPPDLGQRLRHNSLSFQSAIAINIGVHHSEDHR